MSKYMMVFLIFIVMCQLLIFAQEPTFYIFNEDGDQCLSETSINQASYIKKAINKSMTIDYSKWLVENFRPQSEIYADYWKQNSREALWMYYQDGLLFPCGDITYKIFSKEAFGPVIMDTHSKYYLSSLDSKNKVIWKRKISAKMELPVYPFSSDIGLLFYGNKIGGDGYRLYIIQKDNGNTILEIPLKWQGSTDGVDYMDANSISIYYIDDLVIIRGAKIKDSIQINEKRLEKGMKCIIVIDLKKTLKRPIAEENGNEMHNDKRSEERASSTHHIPSRKVAHDNLIAACLNNDIDAVKKQINNGVQINKISKYGYIPLTAAASKCNVEIVRYLLSKGADPNIMAENIEPALIEAMSYMSLRSQCPYNECYETVKILLENGANPNIKDYQNRTPIEYAIMWGMIPVVKILIDKGVNLNVKADWYIEFVQSNCNEKSVRTQRSLLMLAATQPGFIQNTEIIKMLIANGVDVSEKDPCGYTALLIAKKYSDKWGGNYREIVKILEEAGAKE